MARTPKAASQPKAEPPKTLSFEYIKSQFFRVIHADGAVGSITPTGKLHIAFYSERLAIPKMTVHEHRADGTLGKVISEQTISKSSIIREMDVDVIFDGDTLDGLIAFLNEQKVILVSENEKRRALGEGVDNVSL